MFDIARRGSTVGREMLGGLTTFMAMSYIIFVQIGLLGSPEVGMDPDGVMAATCLASAAASILMGLLANYPIALAPGMGENFFFVTIAGFLGGLGFGVGWKMALALTAVSGTVFLLLSVVGFRSRVVNSIPDSLKSGIAAGIGLLIAVVGFEQGSLTEALGGLHAFKGNPVAVLTLIGLAVTLVLMAFQIRGAILLGILITAGIAVAMGQIQWCGLPVAWPKGLEKTAGGMFDGLGGIVRALGSRHAVEVVIFGFILLFMDLFDTVGTLVGVSRRAGLMKNSNLPRAERALAADAVGTIIGAGLGTSTVTSYIESITGVAAGARTGLAAIVTGVLLALATFFSPLAKMIGGGVMFNGAPYQPLIAPALMIVGAMMLRAIRDIDWEDVTEYVPAFLVVLTMPLTKSISAGIAMGFVSYSFGKIANGRLKQCPLIVHIFAALFVVQYLVKTFVMPS